MMIQRKKIAFIRIWPNPPIAASVQRILVESFPEYDVETIDIVRIIKSNKLLILINALHTIREYGLNILQGKDKFNVYFFGTVHLYHWAHEALNKMLRPRQAELAFTFQLQSIFDTSLKGTPNFVYTDHTMLVNLDYPDADPAKLYSRKWIELEELIYRSAAKIFTFSNNVARSLVEQYSCPPNTVSCVYAGGSVELFNCEHDNDNFSNQNILFVGIDWVRKGGPVLVEAFQRLLEIYPKATLTIVGAKPELNLPGINVVGQIPVCQLEDYYKKASIFCLPTRNEPFGMVFVEALTQGLPIVTTNIGAIPDLVCDGRNGYLVPTGDVEKLFEALSKLLDSPEKCREFGERGRRLAETRYNWKSVGTALRTQIMPLLGGNKP
jgi:glycosyltransferase involved in cell wall biosynthesis